MNNINDILRIPERCLLKKKITKAFFKRNFDLTTSEKSLLEDANILMTIEWVASVSPSTANIAAFAADEIIYEEVQVIAVQTGTVDFDRTKQKIAELVQKYIPYPILLIIYNTEMFVLNTCNKRINQQDNGRRTIEKRFFSENISINASTEVQKKFLDSLTFSALDKTDLKTYYDTYTHRIIALQAAQVSGLFIPKTQNRTIEDVQNLERIEMLQKEIGIMQTQAKKETQMNQRVLLNNQINTMRKEIEHLKTLITR